MAITRQWQNLPYGHNEDVISICAMPHKAGNMHVLPHAFRIVLSMCVPISRGVPLSSA